MATKKTSIGGQALIEGIMMRGPKVTAMAVHNDKTKEIILEEYPTKGQDRAKVFKLPFIRGKLVQLTHHNKYQVYLKTPPHLHEALQLF